MPPVERQHEFFSDAIERLKRSGIVQFEAGLTDDEVERAQARYNLRFPPDLRLFLQIALPIYVVRRGEKTPNFPNWRSETQEARDGMQWWLGSPLDGILFDIEHDMWSTNWGERPEQLDDALEMARHEVAKAPMLIPVFGHRFIPAEPNSSGNPVFSVVQTDIINYGNDLATYLVHEFPDAKIPVPDWAAHEPRFIEFWSDIVDHVNGSWVRLGNKS